MMATVPHVTSGLGLRIFQADGFLLTRVYIHISVESLWKDWKKVIKKGGQKTRTSGTAISVTRPQPVRFLPRLLHAVQDVPHRYAGKEAAGGTLHSRMQHNQREHKMKPCLVEGKQSLGDRF